MSGFIGVIIKSCWWSTQPSSKHRPCLFPLFFDERKRAFLISHILMISVWKIDWPWNYFLWEVLICIATIIFPHHTKVSRFLQWDKLHMQSTDVCKVMSHPRSQRCPTGWATGFDYGLFTSSATNCLLGLLYLLKNLGKHKCRQLKIHHPLKKVTFPLKWFSGREKL